MSRTAKDTSSGAAWPRAAGFGQRLVAWFDATQRPLPWRATQDPWAIWVSEVMLQQTRVAAVLSHFQRFLERYPEPAAWAEVSDDELHGAWAGLGYYRRARLLREGARAVVRDHGGKVPSDPASLGKLPGVGTYTKGAVASIAFGLPLPAVDGNVERVLARHRRYELPVKNAVGQRQMRNWVDQAQTQDRPGAFNQALMELGAMVCTPRSPRCDSCPVASDCLGRDAVDRLPVLPKRRAPVDVTARLVLIPSGGGVLAASIPPGEPNAGQWEPPGAGLLVDVAEPDDLDRAVQSRHGARVELGPELGRFRHGITHHRIRVLVHSGRALKRGHLVPKELGDPTVPWTTASRKAFQVAGMDSAEG